MTRLVVVGGGRMGTAVLGGLLGSKWAPAEDIAVVERLEPLRTGITERYQGVRVAESALPADAAVLAVKPADAVAGCRVVSDSGCRRVISIMAGVSIAKLEKLLGAEVTVLRVMPNTPARVGAGMSILAGSESAGEDDLEWAEGVLSSLGEVVRLPEHLLDAATGLSGSGPAYVFLLAEALIDAGVNEGLTRDVSTLLAVQTLLGSARLLSESGDSPQLLRAAVTSPGGTTAAGLRVLEAHSFRSAVLEAVAAASSRARELGR